MQYKTLGKTGMRVSQLCFGTMSFGSRADRGESQRMYSICRDRGINFFDCANVYSGGTAETFLGSFIAAERDKVIITTKAHGPTSDDVNSRGCSAKNLRLSLEASLKRLKTDYVDVFFLHGYDSDTSEETMQRTLDQFIREGKILSIGVSNYAAYQVERLLRISEVKNLAPVQVIQPMYSIAKRQAEVELLPMAKAEGLGVVTYSPLGGGLLSGRYKDGISRAQGRLVENEKYSIRYSGSFYGQLARQFSLLAEELGIEPAPLALRWVMNNPLVTAPIIGSANAVQLEQTLKACTLALSKEVCSRIEAFSPSPPPAHDRSEEQL